MFAILIVLVCMYACMYVLTQPNIYDPASIRFVNVYIVIVSVRVYVDFKSGRLPAANSVEDAGAVLQLAQDLLSKKEFDMEGMVADETFIKQ